MARTIPWVLLLIAKRWATVKADLSDIEGPSDSMKNSLRARIYVFRSATVLRGERSKFVKVWIWPWPESLYESRLAINLVLLQVSGMTSNSTVIAIHQVLVFVCSSNHTYQAPIFESPTNCQLWRKYLLDKEFLNQINTSIALERISLQKINENNSLM